MHHQPLRLLLVLILSYSFTTAQAQRRQKVSFSDVSSMSHPSFPEAEAAFMVKNVVVSYDISNNGVSMLSRHFQRIKIYTDEGVERFGNFSYYLSKGSNASSSEKLRELKVVVFNSEGDQVTTSKLNKKDVFREDYSDNYQMVKAALPNVKPGSIVELKYEIVSPYIYATDRHDFQEDIPVEYSKFELVKPSIIALTPIATGTIPWESDSSERALSNETVTTYTAKDVPPLLDDDFVLNIQDYRSSIKYELHSISVPGRSVQMFSESWENLGKKLLQSSNLGDYLNDRIKDAKPLIAEAMLLPEEERIHFIYRYITDNFAYNNSIGKYAEQKPAKVWESKAGSLADLNVLLINLLRKADIEAYPLVTRTRWSGILNSSYPSLTSLNYLLAAVPVGDTYLLLDASSKYTKIGELPIRALNYAGLLLTTPSKIIQIQNNNKQTVKEVAKLSIDLDEIAIVGGGSDNLKGYAATKYRIKQDEDEDDEDKQALAQDNSSEEDTEEDEEEVDLRDDVAQYTELIGLEDKDSDIKGQFESTTYSCIKSIGKELFIDAFVRAKFNENPFENEQREFPAFFTTAHDLTYIYMLEIPEGYEIKEMPEDLNMKTEGGKASFVYAATQADTKVSVRTQLKISDTLFFPEEYDTLRRFFDAVMDKQKEKIILVKT